MIDYSAYDEAKLTQAQEAERKLAKELTLAKPEPELRFVAHKPNLLRRARKASGMSRRQWRIHGRAIIAKLIGELRSA